MSKIRFRTGSASSPFFQSLNREVNHLLSSTSILKKARRRLWYKMGFFFFLHLTAWLFLYLVPHPEKGGLMLAYILVGISGLLLGFNVSHDAMHGTFSKNRKVNYWLYHLSFNTQGNNAYLWNIRHKSSHHVFPNVDGCDADVDNNPFIRLSPQHPRRRYQRYQHIYSVLVYAVYNLHWFLFKDALYLFKKNVANLQHKKHSLKEYILFFFWKCLYLFLLLVWPVIKGYALPDVLLSFLIMQVVISILFIHFLIATHFCMETAFPAADEEGFLPGDYYRHQLATSLDYSPGNRWFNFFLGGFNAHAAHHLYPKLPHTIYPDISRLIENKAKEFGLPYNKLTLPQAMRSHYRFLKMMGRPEEQSVPAVIS
ncbi:MAG: acyl-CoA desaturase [Chitinophagaceae bacterium]